MRDLKTAGAVKNKHHTGDWFLEIHFCESGITAVEDMELALLGVGVPVKFYREKKFLKRSQSTDRNIYQPG